MRLRREMTDDVDLDPKLKVGDVLISNHGTRWTVIGFTPRGKLDMRSPQGTTLTAWWHWRSDVLDMTLERNGVVIR